MADVDRNHMVDHMAVFRMRADGIRHSMQTIETNDFDATVPMHEDSTADSSFFRKPAPTRPEHLPAHYSGPLAT